MKKRNGFRGLVLMLVTAVSISVMGTSGRQRLTVRRSSADTTSVRIQVRDRDMGVQRRMNTSLYPVQMQVSGRAVLIKSDYNQILPIYTRSGSFYMAMRLNKGSNWLNGLPRGTYFINNRPVTVK